MSLPYFRGGRKKKRRWRGYVKPTITVTEKDHTSYAPTKKVRVI